MFVGQGMYSIMSAWRSQGKPNLLRKQLKCAGVMQVGNAASAAFASLKIAVFLY